MVMHCASCLSSMFEAKSSILASSSSVPCRNILSLQVCPSPSNIQFESVIKFG